MSACCYKLRLPASVYADNKDMLVQTRPCTWIGLDLVWKQGIALWKNQTRKRFLLRATTTGHSTTMPMPSRANHTPRLCIYHYSCKLTTFVCA